MTPETHQALAEGAGIALKIFGSGVLAVTLLIVWIIRRK